MLEHIRRTGRRFVLANLRPLSVADQAFRGWRAGTIIRNEIRAGAVSSGGLRRPKVLVVGAGIAGVVAGLTIGPEADVVIVDSRGQLFGRQASAFHRRIESRIYRWPIAEDPGVVDEILRPLLLADDIASDVVQDLRLRFYERLDAAPGETLRIEFFRRVETISPSGSGFAWTSVGVAGGRTGEAPPPSAPRYADYVVEATGPSGERTRIGDYPWREFWDYDRLDRLAARKRPHRVVVSGVGDGGIMDALRFLLPGIRYSRLVAAVDRASWKARERILELESARGHLEGWYDPDGRAGCRLARWLDAEYAEVAERLAEAPEVTKLLAAHGNPLAEVVLVRRCDHFGDLYPVNRLIVTLLLRSGFLGRTLALRDRCIIERVVCENLGSAHDDDNHEHLHTLKILELEGDCADGREPRRLVGESWLAADRVVVRHGIEWHPDQGPPRHSMTPSVWPL